MVYDSIIQVLSKREVQNAVMTGIELDVKAEKRELSEPLQSIMERDEGLYGIDEVLTFSITNFIWLNWFYQLRLFRQIKARYFALA